MDGAAEQASPSEEGTDDEEEAEIWKVRSIQWDVLNGAADHGGPRP